MEDDMMAAMRTQSLYMMPLMTIFIGWNFALGLHAILVYYFPIDGGTTSVGK
jgi:membrane protein insertase Oxa1/YidC/SpoIIIJ